MDDDASGELSGLADFSLEAECDTFEESVSAQGKHEDDGRSFTHCLGNLLLTLSNLHMSGKRPWVIQNRVHLFIGILRVHLFLRIL